MRRVAHLVLLTLVACGSNADSLGVGAQCTTTSQCNTKLNEVCLTQFKNGYCGLEGCTHDIDCPTDSACVMHTDGNNYCFRVCSTKDECNANRIRRTRRTARRASPSSIRRTTGKRACRRVDLDGGLNHEGNCDWDTLTP